MRCIFPQLLGNDGGAFDPARNALEMQSDSQNLLLAFVKTT